MKLETHSLKDILTSEMYDRAMATVQLLPHLSLSVGAVIAGGAVRRLLFPHPTQKLWDLDVFHFDPPEFLRLYTSMGFSYRDKYGDNCYEFDRVFTGWGGLPYTKVQAVDALADGITSVKDLFETFSFSVCHFAMDGRNLVTTEQAMQDATDCVLRQVGPTLTQKLLDKYTASGFTPLGAMEVNQADHERPSGDPNPTPLKWPELADPWNDDDVPF
jgi:hypothetical protein